MTTLAIGIPLIGRHLSHDWPAVTALLADTLASVFRQTSGDFSLAISCNDIPEGPAFADPRIHYLQLPRVTPAQLARQPRADIWAKKFAVRRWAAASGAAYFFCLDADDLVSRRLVEYVAAAPPGPGFLIAQGYALDHPTGRLVRLPAPVLPGKSFDSVCGSSVVARLDPAATPATRFAALNALFAKGHPLARERFPAIFGGPAAAIPFAAGVYRLNNGENFGRKLASIVPRRRPSDWIFKHAVEVAPEIRDDLGLGR